MSRPLPLVSVIIPVFNGRDYISECLQSVVDQSYPNVEIIAIEDGSDRDSQDIVRRFPSVTYIRQRNTGNATVRNRGILMSKGAYISFLDCDDMFDRAKTDTQVRYLQEHSDCQVVAGLTREFLDSGAVMPQWVRPTALQEDHKGASPGVLMVKRELFDTVGLFDPDFTTTSDTEWIVRAHRSGVSLPFVPSVVLHKRIHANNQSAHPSSRHVASYHRELARIFANR
ncbi:MAG: glycosyltransferase [Candidatus Andersenbacteria bacterium]